MDPPGHEPRLRKPTFVELAITAYAILQGLQWLGIVGLTRDADRGALQALTLEVAQVRENVDTARSTSIDLQWMIKAQVDTNAWQTQMLQEHKALIEEVRRELRRLP